jgi:hypothetical protein
MLTKRKLRLNGLKSSKKLPEKGQSLIILALAFVAMLAFIGLVIDVGSLYVTYTQLKRAVDAAAVAAANNIKSTSTGFNKERLTEAAREMLQVNNVTDVSTLVVYLCTDSGIPAEFDRLCPDSDEAPRKLAWVQATQKSPVYFLSLFGVQSIPFTTSAVGEAATVDLVLVFDSSESMAVNSTGYRYDSFDPGYCNTHNSCLPMREAKDAAAGLVDNLFDGYDQVAVVSYAYTATAIIGSTTDLLTSDMDEAKARITSVAVHDDPAQRNLLAWKYNSPIIDEKGKFNPIYPEDRDGDGFDSDPLFPCIDENKDMWDDTTGEICDDYFPGGDIKVVLDTYDWNGDGILGNETVPGGADLTENNAATLGVDLGGGHSKTINLDPANKIYEGTSFMSTCIGCGLRVATDILKAGGRESSVWVIVFLTDGYANLSDNPHSYSEIPDQFMYGFCGAPTPTSPGDILTQTFWFTFCGDYDLSTRWCIDTDEDECPPGSSPTTTSAPYSVVDYAFDMADAAALLESTNADEPTGEDIIIYSIGLGVSTEYGVRTLRYIANVGEDGSRANDQCADLYHDVDELRTNCGNYYYAPYGAYLDQIFENIAGRIFTKISR